MGKDTVEVKAMILEKKQLRLLCAVAAAAAAAADAAAADTSNTGCWP